MRLKLKRTLPALTLVMLTLYLFISYQMAAGVTRARRVPFMATPASRGLAFEDVEFPSRAGGITLRGWFVPGNRPGPAIIYVHGINGTRGSFNSIELTSRLVRQGFSVLLFDLRGHGASDGFMVSGGYFERYDLLGAFDYLVKRGVAQDRIGVIGFSMGGAIALMAAAEEPAIRAVVADSAFASASDLIAQETARRTMFTEWMVPAFLPGAQLVAARLYGIDVDALSPEEAVARLDYPVLIIHGMADTRIPYFHGVRVHKAAPPGSRLWLVPDAPHTSAFLLHPDEYVERIVEYFNARLGAD